MFLPSHGMPVRIHRPAHLFLPLHRSVCIITGFVWNTERTRKQNEEWEQRLEQLQHYKAEHGDCLVPHGYKDDPSFAEWIHRQRTTFALHIKEGRVNAMIEDRMQKLEAMGFNFVRPGVLD